MHQVLAALAQTESPFGAGLIAIIVMSLLFMFVVFLIVMVRRYTKVGPNEVLIVSGRQHRIVDSQGRERMVGFRIVKGGGTFVLPIFERAETLSLELMTIDVKTPSVYTITGVPVRVDGVAQIKVRGEDVA